MLAACACRNSRQLGPARRGAGSSRARARRLRMLVGETRKPSLPSSPQIRRWPQRGFSRPSRRTSSRTSAGSGGRPRSNQACIACGTRQVTGSCREQGPIGRPELRPRDLAAEKLELVAQHEQLDVLYVQAAAATDKRTKQGPKSEVKKGENHVLDPSSPRAKEGRHQL